MIALSVVVVLETAPYDLLLSREALQTMALLFFLTGITYLRCYALIFPARMAQINYYARA